MRQSEIIVAPPQSEIMAEEKSDAPRPELKRHEFLNDDGMTNGQSIKSDRIHM